MIKADEVSFPPTSTDDLLYFIAQELIIVKNIPITLSSDTIYNYLSTYGPIKCFKTVSTKSDRQEALVLFNDPDTAQNVLNLNINGIGGFYLAKCDIKKHSYILSIDKMPIYSEWDENLVDLDVESNTEQKEPPMSVELLINYAHVFATLYIAIEYLSSKKSLIRFLWNPETIRTNQL